MNTRGVFYGLTLQHNIRHISRALLEGIAFRMRSLRDVLVEIGVDIPEIYTSGGFTRSGLWLQTIANVLGQELLIPKWGDTSSLGAALWVLLGKGIIEHLEDINDMLPTKRIILPEPEIASRYVEIYSIYRELYAALIDTFNRTTELPKI
jgi:gluconokinase